MADQLSLIEAEKEELLNQLEEESSRQDKVWGCYSHVLGKFGQVNHFTSLF